MEVGGRGGGGWGREGKGKIREGRGEEGRGEYSRDCTCILKKCTCTCHGYD